MRLIPRLVFLVVLALGLACLNYTAEGGAEHHREWATAKGLPPPSQPIFYGGAAATTLGAFLLGLSFGRKRSS